MTFCAVSRILYLSREIAWEIYDPQFFLLILLRFVWQICMTLQNVYLHHHHRCCLQLDIVKEEGEWSKTEIETKTETETVTERIVAKSRETVMQTFELIYCKLSEYYGFAILDDCLWYLMQTFCISLCVCACVRPSFTSYICIYKCKPPAQVWHWQLFHSFDIYRCYNPLALFLSLYLYFWVTIITTLCLCECWCLWLSFSFV